MSSSRVRARLLAAVVLVTAVLLPTASAQASAGHTLIVGSGSSWSANAVNQWVADVQGNGLQVVFTPNGSAQGRKDFAYKTTDFGVSDIGFQGNDPVTGDVDTSLGREFAYLPIVAGGTSFPYQVRVAGQLKRDLRLSGLTLAKIFTNQITNWNDPAITADNNGQKLPSLPIIPVVHSEGSGSTAQFTRYLSSVFPKIWGPFLGQNKGTEYFPRKGDAIAQNGSDAVMNYVASSAANGAIGYDEYSYALAKNYPVAKVLNSNGYYTLPNQYNVAVALTKAIINKNKNSPDYLLQDLSQVYVDKDPRTYPLSSYSYAIIPTSASDSKMTSAKRQTVADFLFYSICGGQKEMGPIGYSPLPLNLVKAGFEQINKLKQADPAVDISKQSVTSCHNPTFDPAAPNRNYLAEIAPKPPACDRQGQGPCAGTTDSGTANPQDGRAPVPSGAVSGGGTSTGSGSGTGSSQGSGGSGTPVTGGTSGGGAATSGGGASGGAIQAGQLDPVTGQVISDGAMTTASGNALPNPTDLAEFQRHPDPTPYGVLAVFLLAAALVGPPLVARQMSGRGQAST